MAAFCIDAVEGRHRLRVFHLGGHLIPRFHFTFSHYGPLSFSVLLISESERRFAHQASPHLLMVPAIGARRRAAENFSFEHNKPQNQFGSSSCSRRLETQNLSRTRFYNLGTSSLRRPSWRRSLPQQGKDRAE